MADELARVTRTHTAFLYRLLRAMASIGIINEDTERWFSLTRLGRLLGSDAAGSKRSLAIMAGAKLYRS